VRRELKQVPGIIDVTTFGGTTKQYQAEVDPRKLLQYNVTLPQLMTAIAANNQNAGGNYLTVGSQSVNVRGLGLLRDIHEMGSVLIAEHSGAPVYLRDVADIHEGYQPPLDGSGGTAMETLSRNCIAAEGRAIAACPEGAEPEDCGVE